MTVDAWSFEQRLDEAQDAERRGIPSAALAAYREALPLYRGDYLVDAGYEDWALPRRDHLRARFVSAAVRAGELAVATGSHDEALSLAVRAIETEPWSEDARRLLVAVHLQRGDRAAALRAMEGCRAMLADLGAEPEPATEMFGRLLAG